MRERVVEGGGRDKSTVAVPAGLSSYLFYGVSVTGRVWGGGRVGVYSDVDGG